MPHLKLEYTKNLRGFDEEAALLQLNKALAGSGHFDEIDIKSRAVALDHFVIGTAPNKRAFVHAKLSLMSGRTPDIKKSLSMMLLEELKSIYPSSPDTHIQLCVEILEINREIYAKAVVQPTLP
ncbi:5-carboxymethyl-2-hydroxymuconate Delta-isomerase [Microvirga flavescens]|uniref:5-carboxymethyl-2-hydroxymuconate Delta-isomerase n=1 Tax=Microvirga flavescens TaxID=2249811 RepID=UPI000DD5458A|nr:5-carboxymethyl-2-hydroxymuconate Delta-isomerase [Microvirga flavescens]